MELSELSKYCTLIRGWLNSRYGEQQGAQIWNAVCDQYNEYLKDLPDYGGKKNSHAFAIYGALLIFSLYPLLPDHPPVEELQDFVQNMFMEPFIRLGKVIDLNRKTNMKLINFVFNKVGDKDRRQIKQYPATFCNVAAPFDKVNYAASYSFTQCPNAEFAKKHGLMHVLPLFCNSDYWGISQIHGTLIRRGTCGNADACDYCVVGSNNPMAQKYEIVKDEAGFLVSREKSDSDE